MSRHVPSIPSKVLTSLRTYCRRLALQSKSLALLSPSQTQERSDASLGPGHTSAWESLGEVVCDLILNGDWVTRRVESVTPKEIHPDVIVERTTSLHIDALKTRHIMAQYGLETQDQWAIPLGIFPKNLYLNFDTRSGDGSSLPLLSRRVDAEVAMRLLLSVVRRGDPSALIHRR